MKLIALKSFKLDGKRLNKDDVFEATNTFGRVLIARSSAAEQKEPKQERASRRQYARRDMEAERTAVIAPEETKAEETPSEEQQS